MTPESARSAAILCNGPSITSVTLGDLEGFDLVVAVNLAIERFPWAHVWATTDPPDRLWERTRPLRHTRLVYFTTDNYVLDLLSKGVPIDHIFSVRPPYVGEFTKETNGHRIVIPTPFTVQAWIYRRLPNIRHVRLFGADMRGSGSMGSLARPFTEEETDKLRWLWTNHRHSLALAMRHFRSQGRRLDRHVPPGSPRSRAHPAA